MYYTGDYRWPSHFCFCSARFLYIGGHLARDKTREMVSSRFIWKTQIKDVDDVCQSTNGAKFMKTAAPLHTISICNLMFGIELAAIFLSGLL